jgi:hypothetical protein
MYIRETRRGEGNRADQASKLVLKSSYPSDNHTVSCFSGLYINPKHWNL